MHVLPGLRALATLAALGLPLSAQTTWFVDASATPPGNGSAGSPYASIAFALAQPATLDGDTVAVAPGAYAESVDFLGKAVTVAGQAPGVVIDGQATLPCVRFTSGEGPTSVLRDVRLTNGGGAPVPGFSSRAGGGVLCVGSSPTLIDVEIVANGSTATCVPHDGGGAFVADGSPQFLGCTIDDNVACSSGAGVTVAGASSPTFTDCSISGNRTAAAAGWPQVGGVVSQTAAPDQPTFQGCDFVGNDGQLGGALSGRAQAFDCLFQGNRATVAGGAVFAVTLLSGCTLDGNELYCDGGGNVPTGAGAADTATLVDCVVTNNLGVSGGGLRQCTASGTLIAGNLAARSVCGAGIVTGGGAYQCQLTECIVEGNATEPGVPGLQTRGGGMQDCTAFRCLIVGNLADFGGAASLSDLGSCTVSGNEARDGVDGLYTCGATHCIVWGNGDWELQATFPDFSCVKNWNSSSGNITLDPQWWLATGGDWTLTPLSPCIDAGSPSYPLDPDGSVADMGWAPFDAGYVGSPATYCTASTSAQGCEAQVGWSGTPTLTGPDDLHVTASAVEAQRVGLMVFARSPGAIAAPGGTLCLGSPIVRTAGQVSGGTQGCDGAFDLHLTQAFLLGQGVAPYGHAFAQYWYRSPGAPGDASVSDALELVLLP